MYNKMKKSLLNVTCVTTLQLASATWLNIHESTPEKSLSNVTFVSTLQLPRATWLNIPKSTPEKNLSNVRCVTTLRFANSSWNDIPEFISKRTKTNVKLVTVSRDLTFASLKLKITWIELFLWKVKKKYSVFFSQFFPIRIQ